MTEEEYILVTNLAKMRAVSNLFRDCLFIDTMIVSDYQRGECTRLIYGITEALEQAVSKIEFTNGN